MTHPVKRAAWSCRGNTDFWAFAQMAKSIRVLPSLTLFPLMTLFSVQLDDFWSYAKQGFQWRNVLDRVNVMQTFVLREVYNWTWTWTGLEIRKLILFHSIYTFTDIFLLQENLRMVIWRYDGQTQKHRHRNYFNLSYTTELKYIFVRVCITTSYNLTFHWMQSSDSYIITINILLLLWVHRVGNLL